MSDHSLKRNFVFSVLFFLTAGTAFAITPSARYDTTMVWDTAIHRAVLFGGLTLVDSGTKVQYELDDTWEWTGVRWIQRFVANSPPARGSQSTVFDSVRNRVVLFGGRQGKLNLNDTWSYDGNDWTQIQTAAAPPVRELAGAAYDSDRDRIVLFGGTQQTYTNNGRTLVSTFLHDTWEFDGTNWKQILTDGPAVTKPNLVYDPVRKQTIMMGYDSKVATVMYAYDAAAAKWNQLTPTVLPACANEAAMTWQSSNNTILFTGGVCANSAVTDDTYEWDGTNWNKINVVLSASRFLGPALTFDPDHQEAVMFGGDSVAGALNTFTFVYANTTWAALSDTGSPNPRSLFAFVADPVRNVTYLFGGLNDANSFGDFWYYQNGQFHPITNVTLPTGCDNPAAAFDSDRQKMVMLCSDGSTWEFDGAAWAQNTTSKVTPPIHRFSSLAYDQTLKKMVFFGGYDGSYLNQTWTFDGTTWAQVKKNPPPSRSHAAMWYDSTLKKTVIYGGIGRVTSTDVVTRYSDMWSFDGTGWTEIKPDLTPGMRYGAQVAIDPKTGHALVFGGIRVDTDDKLNQIQVYANDMWDWDGTTWTKVTTAVAPPARENGGFALDPLRNELVMFGGYSGFYLSDTWSFANGKWAQVLEVLSRRRASR